MLINPLCLHLSNFAPPSSISSVHINPIRSIQSSFVRNHKSKLSLSLNGPNCGGLRCQISISSESKFDDDNDDDGFYIKKAVELAKKATGFTSPNPMVGCVIVKDGKIVGQGFHPKAGQPHAEVFALRDAGDLAEDATAYVSLEPCNHYGRTPPCTEALIKAKVKRVVVGMVDPNPIVASKGVEKLRNAGIDVKVGVEEELCKRLNEAYIHKMVTGKPFVTLRYTMSLNGNLLTKLGEGAGECGGYFSKLLQEYDVVVLSANSLVDAPSLFTSQEPGANQPLHILIGNDHGQVAQRPISEHDPSDLIIFTDEESTKEITVSRKGIERVVLERIGLDRILEYCNQQGKCSVLIDWRCGNGDEYHQLIKQCVEKNLVQKVVMEIVPFWGGNRDESLRWGIDNLKGMRRLTKLTPLASGPAVVLEGYF